MGESSREKQRKERKRGRKGRERGGKEKKGPGKGGEGGRREKGRGDKKEKNPYLMGISGVFFFHHSLKMTFSFNLTVETPLTHGLGNLYNMKPLVLLICLCQRWSYFRIMILLNSHSPDFTSALGLYY